MEIASELPAQTLLVMCGSFRAQMHVRGLGFGAALL